MINEEKELLDAIEYSMFMSPGIEGVMEKYQHEYLRGYITPTIDHVESNKVGIARIPEELVEKTIQEVINDFMQYGVKSVGWVYSPQTKPSNLAEKLEEFGFKIEIPVWGMKRPIEEEMVIKVVEEFDFKSYFKNEAIDILKEKEMLRMGEKAYGFPVGAGDVYLLNIESSRNLDYTLYIAYEKEEGKPVAFSAITYVPDTDVARLSGAATLPEYRKKGIYSSMLKLRYDQAKRDGFNHLIIQALEATSAPIAAKYGFKKVCELPIYAWKSQQKDDSLFL